MTKEDRKKIWKVDREENWAFKNASFWIFLFPNKNKIGLVSEQSLSSWTDISIILGHPRIEKYFSWNRDGNLSKKNSILSCFSVLSNRRTVGNHNVTREIIFKTFSMWLYLNLLCGYHFIIDFLNPRLLNHMTARARIFLLLRLYLA